MRPRGHAEIERAKADGRWDRAYAGQAVAELPDDLARVLAASPAATVRFAGLTRARRYTVINRVITAPNETSRAKRIARFIAELEAAPEG
jgi:uncharacterized protein YdeI (YjbR/CyaY-like superfamily)